MMKIALVFALLCLLGFPSKAAEAAPRGYLTTPAELQEIKKLADARYQPYNNAVRSMIVYGYTMLPKKWAVPAIYYWKDNKSTSEPPWMTEMSTAAYGLSLAYILQKEAAFAEKARQLILAIQEVENLNGDYQRQAMLNVSIHIPKFIYAADLLEDWDGWSLADKRAFQEWIAGVAYPVARRGLDESGGNWHAWATSAVLVMADYCWDRPDLVFKSENAALDEKLTAAQAWELARREFFAQAGGYKIGPTASSCDHQVFSQKDLLKKSMIRPDGGIPDELRRGQTCDTTVLEQAKNASTNYMGFHRDGLMVACEVAYRRGDSSLYDYVAVESDEVYIPSTGAKIILPPGRGSPRETLTFLVANADKGGPIVDLQDGHRGSLEIFLRRYRDRLLPRLVDWRYEDGQFVGGRLVVEAWPEVYVKRVLAQLEPLRPVMSAWVPFTTLTHADPLALLGEPPQPPAPQFNH